MALAILPGRGRRGINPQAALGGPGVSLGAGEGLVGGVADEVPGQAGAGEFEGEVAAVHEDAAEESPELVALGAFDLDELAVDEFGGELFGFAAEGLVEFRAVYAFDPDAGLLA